ncbi:hypothetical protein, partial [Pseudomonas syringae]|uniref:hypothetical protein n=1 Tax=Pseudomonas syringae TaxID=317 RepID=UPI00195A3484
DSGFSCWPRISQQSLSEQHCAKCGVSFVWFLIFLIGICLSLFILFNFLSQGAQSGYTHAYRL